MAYVIRVKEGEKSEWLKSFHNNSTTEDKVLALKFRTKEQVERKVRSLNSTYDHLQFSSEND